MMKQAANIPLVCEMGIDKLSFDDFSLDVDAMITAALRMFMELGMVQKFKIDYEVRLLSFFICFPLDTWLNLLKTLFHNVSSWQLLTHVLISVSLYYPPDTVQMAADCQKELQNGSLSQLETCLQRLPVHVCHAYGKDHAAITVDNEIIF